MHRHITSRSKPIARKTRSGLTAALGVMTKICGVILILGVAPGCAAVPYGYANNSEGRAAAATMCKSMREFVNAPVDASGLRRAWFLNGGDFYAPMASDPSDAASRAFYESGVGRLTHYLWAPEFAAALASCLSQKEGYARVCQSQAEDAFRASFEDKQTGRSVELLAAEGVTSVLVAEEGWAGDLEKSLSFSTTEETPNKSIQPTCEDARG